MTAEEYRKYLKQDFSDIDIKEMPDLKEYQPDCKKSLADRQKAYLEKVTGGTSTQLAEVGLYNLLGQFIDKNDDGTACCY